MSQNVARPSGQLQARSAATPLKAQNKKRSNQLKFGVQLAYSAGKENVKFITWGTLKTASGAMWLAGNTTDYIGRAGRIIGGILVKAADGLANFTGWLFG
jgi:hypothetical protein